MKRKSSLAASAAAVTKKLLGAVVEQPRLVELPKAVAEIHVSPEDVIPAGTVITREIAIEAGLDADDIEALIEDGHVTLVEVYAIAAAEEPADEPQG